MLKEPQILRVPREIGLAPEGWSWESLDVISEGVFDCPHSTPTYTEDGPYVVRTQDISTGVLRLEGTARVSEDSYSNRIKKVEPRFGDLLYSREGTYFGIAAEVPEKIRVCLGQRMVLIRPHHERINSRYLRYWLNSPVMARYIRGFRDGTVAERLNLPVIRALPILCPPRPRQEAVVRILGALDDKIAVNDRIAAISSELVSAYFSARIWDYRSDHELPKGYSLGCLQDLCERIGNGGTPKRGVSEYWDDGDIYWYKTGELNDGPLLASSECITETGLRESSCKLWPSGTVLVALYASPTVGRLGILQNEAAFNQACSGLIAKEEFGELIVLETLRATRERLQGIATGAAQQNINQKILADHAVTIPSVVAAAEFNEKVFPIYRRLIAAMRESGALTDLRDTLLPKLMSGQICINDAERIVEDAT